MSRHFEELAKAAICNSGVMKLTLIGLSVEADVNGVSYTSISGLATFACTESKWIRKGLILLKRHHYIFTATSLKDISEQCRFEITLNASVLQAAAPRGYTHLAR
ncbi:hypothetical protein [Paraferrimonas haliotis]|uniref:Uncharacterized protein n=1 Tax=Paraferrimonas haliotis TaxID=2013866 RepID=A0AA37TMV1_9GAMM|nr:hypothetical protein [Paraferrimonas haliotis]GLS83248.1 hypothetical protein GCM10007894_12250 [Paraferrimonas haliotis]